MSKIAIITDSSCDLPKEYIKENKIFVLPLQVNMPNGSFLDGVNITPEDVYKVMPDVVPTTSQPSPEDVMKLFEQVKKEGYTQAIVVSISAVMSGTYSVYKLVAEEEKELELRIFNSRRLSMALGHLVIYAAELRDKGLSLDEIYKSLEDGWKLANGMFCIPTLKYLVKGGRIGLVAGTIGTILGIIPVISINDEGRYYTELKTRHYNIAVKKMAERLREIVKDKVADIAVIHGDAFDKAKDLMDSIKESVKTRKLFISSISPALGVHTGRGLVGITYRLIND